MKDLIISEEIKAEASRLQGELHKFCVANGVPMVACTLQGRVKTTEGWKIEKMLSCHIDGRCGAVDTTILAASGGFASRRCSTSHRTDSRRYR
ncbi:hypothetical protein EDC47_12818 [Raoultella planticola]|uniref:hypothetical protein n=1 Tax=Raoultella planticola TaxID=575 RepID=UPI00104BC7C2|nr:hypothetical protein [Raoultella planticola]TCL42857.1 hypothetical protein EDC47_12818 [Raoultella planticola]